MNELPTLSIKSTFDALSPSQKWLLSAATEHLNLTGHNSFEVTHDREGKAVAMDCKVCCYRVENIDQYHWVVKGL
jgi:hypothetical protein